MADKTTFDRSQYFALLDGADLASACMERFDKHTERMKRNKRHSRMLRSWRMYYGLSPDGTWDTSTSKVAGKKGELTLIKPNHYRSVLRKIVQMATTDDPAWEPEATNTDVASQRGAGLARNVLDHYGHEEKLYERFVDWAEAAMMLGEAWMAAPWDKDLGREIGVKDVRPAVNENGDPVIDPATQQARMVQRLIYEGDFRFALLTPWDCAIEAFSNNRDKPNWAIFRIPINRYDLAAIAPDSLDQIMGAPTRTGTLTALEVLNNENDDDDDGIYLYFFYHRRTPAVPFGRQAFFVDAEGLLFGKAQNLEYREIPLFRVAPADVLLQDGGYTEGFDIQAICEAIGAQISTLLSNNAALGVQRFIADRGANVEWSEIATGLGVIYKQKGFEFGPANFMPSPPEAYAFLEVLMKQLELLGGVNAVARGDVQAAKGDSGSKSALLLSAVQQAQSGFQKAMRVAWELLGSHMIETLQTHANTERVVSIVGKSNAASAAEFTGAQLGSVRRVRVRKGNPMLQTLEGRLQLAEIFKDLIDDPERLWEMLQSGRFDVLGEPDIAERNLIREENEALEAGKEPVIVSPFDEHLQHIRAHRACTASPQARRDPMLIKRVRDHVMGHVMALMKLPPPMLAAMGQQSMANMDPNNPMGGGAGAGGQQASGGGKPKRPPPETAKNGKAKKPPAGKRGGQPVDGANQPRMPKGPTNPATGEQVPVANQPPPQV